MLSTLSFLPREKSFRDPSGLSDRLNRPRICYESVKNRRSCGEPPARNGVFYPSENFFLSAICSGSRINTAGIKTLPMPTANATWNGSCSAAAPSGCEPTAAAEPTTAADFTCTPRLQSCKAVSARGCGKLLAHLQVDGGEGAADQRHGDLHRRDHHLLCCHHAGEHHRIAAEQVRRAGLASHRSPPQKKNKKTN